MTLADKPDQRYELIKILRKNRRHIIYKARDTSSNSIVVLKILSPNASKNQALVQSLYSESLNTASLSHPNIVEVFDAGRMGNEQFIAMEYLSGYNFMELIKKNIKFTIEQIIFIMLKISRAMEYFHSKGVIHSDIKPQHIILTDKKEIKIIDFGLSILKGLGDSKNDDVISGTALYMSPEQIRGEVLDITSDIYSFGATIFHIIALKPPFDGEDIYFKHINAPIPDIGIYRQDIPNYIKDTVKKCLSKDKKRRFSHSSEIINFLKRNS